jgi:probable F420-dependent oxidoreductase
MKFSTSLPLLRDLRSPEPYRETFQLAMIAEESGFDTITIGQHHFRQGDPADPLTLLAGIVTRTSRVRVGTGVFILPMHDPIQVAEQVATIDQLSGGRISLGVGTGWNSFEYRVLGVPFAERGGRMEEALQILRLVWSQENTSFKGRYYEFPELTVHPRPIQQPSPPLWVAGVRKVSVDRAARLGDAWLCGPVESLAAAKHLSAMYRESCAAVGKEPVWILRRFGWVKPTRREVEEHVLPLYVKGLVDHWRESTVEADSLALIKRIDDGEDVPAAEIAQDRLVWGSPEDAIEQIQRFRDETGADHVHVAFGAGLPAEGVNQSSLGTFDELAAMLRLYGTEVIRAFSDA